MYKIKHSPLIQLEVLYRVQVLDNLFMMELLMLKEQLY